MQPKLKICGMKYPENIAQVQLIKPDYLGFVFYEKSPRFIGEHALTLPKEFSNIKKVGVFVDASFEKIKEKVDQSGLDVVQLHGNEDPGFVKKIKNLGVEVIKSFGVAETMNWNLLLPYEQLVDYYLFDTKSPVYGGTGIPFRWEILQNYPLETPYFLSGGIGPDNMNAALQMTDHRFFALDVNSKFEIAPGLKDFDLLRATFKR